MPKSFADLLRLLKPDASLLRRPAEAKQEGDAAAPSVLARLRGVMPGRKPVADGAAEDVAARRLAAMARAEQARTDRMQAGRAAPRVASARMA